VEALGVVVATSTRVPIPITVSTPSRPGSPKRPSIAPIAEFAPSPARTRLFTADLSSSKTGPLPDVKDADIQSTTSKYIQDIPRSLSSLDHRTPFYRKHILSVKSFDRKDLHLLYGVAQEMRTLVEKSGQIDILAGKVMCSAFWEPSTRTSCSFETAMTRLGGGVVSINQITSSIAKGESLGDTGELALYF
jgi:carbamoyl-phosphate synthase/aspartate carbamoyltransferase